jgi:hypothetical protein
MTDAPRIAVLGNTDLATALTAELLAAGVELVSEVSDANVVFSAVAAMMAAKTAQEMADVLAAGAIYADASAGTPTAKHSLAELFASGSFADVALTVTDGRVTIAASGSAAPRLVDLLGDIVAVEAISDAPGVAATRTLLRILLDNGMANVLVDSLWAAESLGQADWMHQEILRAYELATAQSAQAALSDVSVNFKRRQMDMQDVVELLSESGFESTVLAPIQFTHGRIMHSKKIPHAKG